MLGQLTPATLAVYSVAVLLIPAAVAMLGIILSILVGHLSQVLNLRTGSKLFDTLHAIDVKLMYSAFISVIVMNVTALGLFASAIWATADFLSSLF